MPFNKNLPEETAATSLDPRSKLTTSNIRKVGVFAYRVNMTVHQHRAQGPS